MPAMLAVWAAGDPPFRTIVAVAGIWSIIKYVAPFRFYKRLS
jgi:hypothetical protein